MTEINNRKLSFTLLKYIVLFSIAFTMMMTVIQVYLDYRASERIIYSTLDQIEKSYTKSLANSLWNLDDDQINIQTDGLLKLGDIVYIKILEKREDTYRVYFERGLEQTDKFINREFSLYSDTEGNDIEIGKLQVQASLQGVYNRAIKRGITILLTQTVETFIIALLFLYIIHILVTKKIIKLSNYAKALTLKNLDVPFVLDKDSDDNNEIDSLIQAINQMRVKLKLNIDKIKQSEANIKKERDYSKDLVKGSPVVICGILPDGRINFINPSGEKILGFSQEEIVGLKWESIVNVDGTSMTEKDIFSFIKSGDVYNYEVVLNNKDGKARVFSWSSFLKKNDEDVVTEIVGFGNDITEKKKAEEEIKRYQEHLEVLVEKRTAEVHEKNKQLQGRLEEIHNMQSKLIAQEKLASLGSLTSGIAHELNNPLNFIVNFAFAGKDICEDLTLNALPFIDDKETPAEVLGPLKEGLDDLANFNRMIHNHGKRAEQIIRSMLDHSRTKDSKKEFGDINDILEENLNFAFHAFRAKYSNFNSTLDKEMTENIPSTLMSKGDIGRVFLNLFSNAFYSLKEKREKEEARGIDFSPSLKVTSNFSKEMIEIHVVDNGVGIDSKKVNDIFNPFFTTKPTGEGTGLGLSMSHEIIVGLHHGTIEVSSKEGEYADFLIRLPIVVDDEAESEGVV